MGMEALAAAAAEAVGIIAEDAAAAATRAAAEQEAPPPDFLKAVAEDPLMQELTLPMWQVLTPAMV